MDDLNSSIVAILQQRIAVYADMLEALYPDSRRRYQLPIPTHEKYVFVQLVTGFVSVVSEALDGSGSTQRRALFLEGLLEEFASNNVPYLYVVNVMNAMASGIAADVVAALPVEQRTAGGLVLARFTADVVSDAYETGQRLGLSPGHT